MHASSGNKVRAAEVRGRLFDCSAHFLHWLLPAQCPGDAGLRGRPSWSPREEASATACPPLRAHLVGCIAVRCPESPCWDCAGWATNLSAKTTTQVPQRWVIQHLQRNAGGSMSTPCRPARVWAAILLTEPLQPYHGCGCCVNPQVSCCPLGALHHLLMKTLPPPACCASRPLSVRKCARCMTGAHVGRTVHDQFKMPGGSVTEKPMRKGHIHELQRVDDHKGSQTPEESVAAS